MVNKLQYSFCGVQRFESTVDLVVADSSNCAV